LLFGRIFVERLELRVNPSFNWALAEEIGAERMNSPGARFLKVSQSMFETLAPILVASGSRTRPFQFGAQPKLEFAGSLVRERHRYDSIHSRTT
jgi:hypothetical protein